MRKWHRWITVLFGIFMLFIAITGLGSHFAAMYARGSVFETEERSGPRPAQGAQASAPAQASPAAPKAEGGRPAPSSAGRLVGLFHHLHSGEFFGPAGVVISLLSGFALLFFAVSGMWMYFQMFLNRRGRGRGEIFWK